MSEPNPTKKQKEAIQLACEGHNMWIVGPAGVGKSFVINSIVKHLGLRGKNVCVTAMTGAAASLLPEATTLHRFTGAGPESLKMHLSAFVDSHTKLPEKKRKILMSVDTLIIDEAGMHSIEQFNHLDQYLRHIRRCRKSLFGGIQVILVGDIAQIPPSDATAGAGVKRDEMLPQESVFQYPDEGRWKIIALNEFMRSAEDECLQQICLALIDQNEHVRRMAVRLLNRLCYDADAVESPQAVIQLAHRNGSIIVTPTKRKVDYWNDVESALHCQDAQLCVFDEPVSLRQPETLSADQIDFLGGIEGVRREDQEIVNRGTFTRGLKLFPRAQVQLRVNSTDGKTPFYNGELCTFLGKSVNATGTAEVKLRRIKDGITLYIRPVEHKSEYEDDVGKLGYLALPIIRAISTTVHKVQGQTMDSVIFDPTSLSMFGKNIPNILFVSVSRARRYKDIRLTEPIAEELLCTPSVNSALKELWELDFMADYPRASPAKLEQFLST